MFSKINSIALFKPFFPHKKKEGYTHVLEKILVSIILIHTREREKKEREREREKDKMA